MAQADASLAGPSDSLDASRADEYEKLSQRDHVLRRPDMYIGPTAPRSEMTWVLDEEEGVFKKSRVEVSPGLVQIFNEILVNAIDRQFDKSWGGRMSKIDIRVRSNEIIIESDGGPIPVEIHTETGLYVPTLVFGEFNSGNNFDDNMIRFVGGRNGVGAKATNVFSDAFEVEVKDPVNRLFFRQRWEGGMEVRHDPEITPMPNKVFKGSVKVTFRPNLARFGLRTITKDHLAVFRARAYDAAACTRENILITFNRRKLKVKSFSGFANQVVGPSHRVELDVLEDSTGMVRAEIAVGRSTSGFQALGLVNGIRCNSGSHMDTVVDQLITGVFESLPAKLQKKAKPSAIRNMLSLVVKVVINNPDFSSQTKTVLTTPPEKFGFDFELHPKFIKKVAEFDFREAIEAASKMSEIRELKKSSRSRVSVAKLDDAAKVGKGKNCTLILTEGDSAKALAVAGISEVGRSYYGVFPLKGKLLNTRTASPNQLRNNQEIHQIVDAVGLEWGREYTADTAAKRLRYRYVMIFSDQDLDGHHIAGLVISFFHCHWPSLLQAWPDFIQRFATPIVKVFSKQRGQASAVEEFFTQGDFAAWQNQQPRGWQKHYRAKYYKGLGTSTRQEAVSYFSDLDKHVLNLQYDASGDDGEAVARAFDGLRAEDRKRWLQSYDPNVELDYLRREASISEFFEQQFKHFSVYMNKRSIPLLMDGLKPSQRKAIYVIRSLRGETKVSTLTGLVSAKTHYHHGDASLEKAIVGLAQDFVGTNNVNLIMPNGMFGSRLQGPTEHAASRYLHTELAPVASAIFRSEDDNILTLEIEDGEEAEPRQLLPVVPVALINGFKGIGTGWSTDGPSYHPLEVSRALARLIRGEEAGDVPLMPWYDKWHGQIYDDGTEKLYSEGRWRLYQSGQDEEEAGEGNFENADSVEITELPLGVWTDKYLQSLEAKFPPDKLGIYKCADHDDQNVHLILSFRPEDMEPILSRPDAPEAMGQLLGLKKRLLRNMMLFHSEDPEAEPLLTRFSSPEEILQAFYRTRLPFYSRRREQLQRKLEHKIALADNRHRFIHGSISRSLKLGNRTLQEVEETLEQAGLDRLLTDFRYGLDQDNLSPPDGDFDYLLRLPFSSLTRERVSELGHKLEELHAQLDRLRHTSSEDLWLADIEEFENAYSLAYPHAVARTSVVSTRSDTWVAPGKVGVSMSDKELAEQVRPPSKRRFGGAFGEMARQTHLQLERRKVSELKEACGELGLSTTGKKPDLIRRVLSFVAKDYEDEAWLKSRTVKELQVHLKAWELPTRGSKMDMVKRLLKA